MKAVIYGVGAVGARVARQLTSTTPIEDLVLLDVDLKTAEEAAVSLGEPARAVHVSALRVESRLRRLVEQFQTSDVVVLTAPEDHSEAAEAALKAGLHVVSTSDDLETIEKLLELNELATSSGKSLIVGAGFSPGFSCLLAMHAANGLDVVDEIHIGKFGTGGPSCARQHHKALRADGLEWRNQQWEKARGGSGRELYWFPDPVGGLDCYHAALPEPLLLLPAFAGLVRCTARVSATRRDMSTKWLPMLRKPHPEGMIGAIRVEVRGWSGTARDAVVFGGLDRPAVAAGAVASAAARWAVSGRMQKPGAGGLASMIDDPLPMLKELHEAGVRAAVFEGIPHG